MIITVMTVCKNNFKTRRLNCPKYYKDFNIKFANILYITCALLL